MYRAWKRWQRRKKRWNNERVYFKWKRDWMDGSVTSNEQNKCDLFQTNQSIISLGSKFSHSFRSYCAHIPLHWHRILLTPQNVKSSPNDTIVKSYEFAGFWCKWYWNFNHPLCISIYKTMFAPIICLQSQYFLGYFSGYRLLHINSHDCIERC